MKSVKRNFFAIAVLATCILGSWDTSAQIIQKRERFVEDYNWKVGIGVNMMDMNFLNNELPDGANTSMINMYMPSKISISRHIGRNFSVEVTGSMNKAETGNYVNGTLVTEDKTIITADAYFSYSLGNAFNIPYVDPYVKVGAGHLNIESQSLTTAGGGIGLNFYLADFGIGKDYRYPTEKWYSRFGINIEATYRNILFTSVEGQSLQYSGGIFYKF